MNAREKELNAIVKDAHELIKELRTGNSYECAVEMALARAMKLLSSPGSRLSLSPFCSQSFGSYHVSLCFLLEQVRI